MFQISSVKFLNDSFECFNVGIGKLENSHIS